MPTLDEQVNASKRYAATVALTVALGSHHDALEVVNNEFFDVLPETVQAELISHEQGCVRFLQVVEAAIGEST